MLTAPVASGSSTSESYAWTGLPPGCSSLNTSELYCLPAEPGNYSVGVTESDHQGGSVSETPVPLVVLPPLLLNSLQASAQSVVAGTSVRFDAEVGGGTTPYTFAWAGLPAGCASPTTSSVSCTFPATGTSWVTVVATDAAGSTIAGSVQVVVVGAPAGPALPSFDLLAAAVGAVAVANVVIWWWPRREQKEREG
jgi:hypothetical protein